ncbi:MAG: energy transducer TonB [Bacteroidia bacterium]|nr:energy transducer TonB [Bacteroidia bacterium]
MKRLNKEDKAGVYITVIVHLTVIIVLLASQLSISLQKENSFVLDFSKQENVEKLKKELAFKEEVSKRIDELIETGGSVPVRNVAVDRGVLKDDRGTDAEQLYKDAEKLQEDLNRTFNRQDSPDDYVPLPENKPENTAPKPQQEIYSGPSVVSYSLDGRKASRLPIPAYRCMGAGEVTVIITVDNAGNVIVAKIDENVSSDDTCLRNFAIRAARSAKFSASPTAPARQVGNIVYAFIAQ